MSSVGVGCAVTVCGLNITVCLLIAELLRLYIINASWVRRAGNGLLTQPAAVPVRTSALVQGVSNIAEGASIGISIDICKCKHSQVASFGNVVLESDDMHKLSLKMYSHCEADTELLSCFQTESNLTLTVTGHDRLQTF